MVKGRPPKLFSDEQVLQMGIDLVNWVTQNPTEWNWVKWYWCKYQMFREDWKTLIQRPGFLPYYQMARKIIAENMIQNKNVHHSYGHRYLGLYDDEVLEHEEAIKDRESARKNSEGSSLSEALEAIEHFKTVAASIRKEPPLENKAS